MLWCHQWEGTLVAATTIIHKSTVIVITSIFLSLWPKDHQRVCLMLVATAHLETPSVDDVIKHIILEVCLALGAQACLLDRCMSRSLCVVGPQFRAVADQLYRTPHAHFELRKAVVSRLRKHPSLYSEYVPEEFATYCRQMEKDGTWGDHVTLQVGTRCAFAFQAFPNGILTTSLGLINDSCYSCFFVHKRLPSIN